MAAGREPSDSAQRLCLTEILAHGATLSFTVQILFFHVTEKTFSIQSLKAYQGMFNRRIPTCCFS